MSRTRLEQSIKHRRTRDGILVPLIEDFMRRPVRIDSEEDVQFLAALMRNGMTREERRGSERVFSPSSLSSCLRYVFLSRNAPNFGIEPVSVRKADAHFYFINGEWLHYKWDFILWKMWQAIGDPKVLDIHGFEIPVESKRGDHKGTIDVVASVYEIPYIIDWKGINTRAFASAVKGFPEKSYCVQTADYMVLWNSGTIDGERRASTRIENALLIAENKGGPDPRHPIALHEDVIPLTDYRPEVQRRLEVLRAHEEEGTIPEPECISTTGYQFRGCPFQGYCKKEVKEIERSADSGDSKKYRVGVPPKRRSNRTRRNSKRT